MINIIFSILYILLVAEDIFTKYLVVNKLKSIGEVCVIDNFFYFSYVENEGMAFGLMNGGRWLFIALTIVVLFALFIYIFRSKNSPLIMRFAALLIAAGATGNLIDRIRQGYVVDFLRFVFFGHSFAVFNFADILVTCGTVLLCLCVFFYEKIKDREN